MTGTPSSLHGQHVLILGLGTSGLAMTRWCTREGARVTVADTRAEPPQLAALKQELPTASFVHGSFSAALIDGSDLKAVYVSPGLTPPQCAPVSDAARAIGLPVAGELQLFSQALAELRAARNYAPKVLAVTGTNGKTTVTSLTAQLVARADFLNKPDHPSQFTARHRRVFENGRGRNTSECGKCGTARDRQPRCFLCGLRDHN